MRAVPPVEPCRPRGICCRRRLTARGTVHRLPARVRDRGAGREAPLCSVAPLLRRRARADEGTGPVHPRAGPDRAAAGTDRGRRRRRGPGAMRHRRRRRGAGHALGDSRPHGRAAQRVRVCSRPSFTTTPRAPSVPPVGGGGGERAIFCYMRRGRTSARLSAYLYRTARGATREDKHRTRSVHAGDKGGTARRPLRPPAPAAARRTRRQTHTQCGPW
jgi:hypothetical protein